MKSNWQNFVAWLKSKNITTHTIGAFALSAGIAITDNAWGCRDFLLQLFRDHPKLGSDLVLIAGAIAAYKRSSSKAGTVANAQAILAKPDAPTATQVEAASTTK